jgi:hypothetical protein
MTIHDQNKIELRERLLDVQTTDAALRADYERKMKAMFEVQLSAVKKLWFVTLILFSVGAGGMALVLGLTEPLPLASRASLLLGAGFSAAWCVYFIQLLVRGVYRRRIDAPMAAGMAFIFTLVMCGLLALGGVPAERVLLIAMLFLIPAGIILLRTIIEQSEMRTQERLVELQYELRTLAKRFDDDSGSNAGVLR